MNQAQKTCRIDLNSGVVVANKKTSPTAAQLSKTGSAAVSKTAERVVESKQPSGTTGRKKAVQKLTSVVADVFKKTSASRKQEATLFKSIGSPKDEKCASNTNV